MTLAKEGEFYKFSNLIFAGWDHYIRDERGASFKRKILQNEMRIALRAEKLKVPSSIAYAQPTLTNGKWIGCPLHANLDKLRQFGNWDVLLLVSR